MFTVDKEEPLIKSNTVSQLPEIVINLAANRKDDIKNKDEDKDKIITAVKATKYLQEKYGNKNEVQ